MELSLINDGDPGSMAPVPEARTGLGDERRSKTMSPRNVFVLGQAVFLSQAAKPRAQIGQKCSSAYGIASQRLASHLSSTWRMFT